MRSLRFPVRLVLIGLLNLFCICVHALSWPVKNMFFDFFEENSIFLGAYYVFFSPHENNKIGDPYLLTNTIS